MSPSHIPASPIPVDTPTHPPNRGPIAWKRRLFWALGTLLCIGLMGAIAVWISLPDVRYLISENPRTTSFIEIRKDAAKQRGKTFVLRWKWRPIQKISRYLAYAVIAAEDARFWEHNGVDWDAITGAARNAWETKTLSRGGSTITQQLAKNLYLSPARNPLRKIREFLITKRLETELSKQRILELYLNIAEWGDGIFGAEAAARKWYRTSASKLTPAQAARLAVALPNPFTRSVKVRSKQLNQKAARLVRAMRAAGLINTQQMLSAYESLGRRRKKPVTLTNTTTPRKIPIADQASQQSINVPPEQTPPSSPIPDAGTKSGELGGVPGHPLDPVELMSIQQKQ